MTLTRNWWNVCVGVGMFGCLLLITTGCGGSKSAAPAKPQGTSAVPRITPPPPRRSEPTAEEPSPEKPPPPAPADRHVGAWLQWQVAQAPAIEGKIYLKLIVNPGTDSVLQLTSYDTPLHEEFPSLLIRALTPAATLVDLVNKKLPAQIYIQIDQDGNLIHNQATQPMEVVITEIDGKNVRGIFAGQAHDVDLGGNGPITGKFQAIVE